MQFYCFLAIKTRLIRIIVFLYFWSKYCTCSIKRQGYKSIQVGSRNQCESISPLFGENKGKLERQQENPQKESCPYSSCHFLIVSLLLLVEWEGTCSSFRFAVSPSTVSRVWRRYHETGLLLHRLLTIQDRAARLACPTFFQLPQDDTYIGTATKFVVSPKTFSRVWMR